ncbi:ATP-binding cassette domain-containing protein, partial [Aldersonia kunmingensis]|uniref:ATP-binding cassette domain-containing protein n=1 Tax=Aldersonia kunmingensis TaxID=408066 RepID=UPI000A785759
MTAATELAPLAATVEGAAPKPGAAATPKLRIENVNKRFAIRGESSDLVALQDINLDVAAGEFLVLVGPSGCGKSTLLDL